MTIPRCLSRPGGSGAPSTRSIHAPSRIPTATAWGTSPASPRASTTSPALEDRGDLARRRSSRPRWPTSATTSPTTATSTRSSARSPTSTSWSPQCHARDIKLVLDWVPNHSSDQHPWFLESRSSRDNPKRDWYIWRDAAQRLGRRCSRPAAPRGPRRDHGPVLPAQLHARAARPQLGQPGGRRGDARHAALLDGPRRRRAAPGRDRQDRQGPAAARPGRRAQAPRRGLGVDPRLPARHPQGRRRIRRPDDRGGGGAAGPAPHRRLPRVRRPAAPGAQLRLHRPGLGRRGLRRLHRRLRARWRRRRPGPPGSWPTTTSRGRASRFDHDGLGAAARSARSW